MAAWFCMKCREDEGQCECGESQELISYNSMPDRIQELRDALEQIVSAVQAEWGVQAAIRKAEGLLK